MSRPHHHPIFHSATVDTPQIKRCCEALTKTLMKQRYAWLFLEPVNPQALNIPDYFDIIKRPMDLSTVLEKLRSGTYKTVQEWADDCQLIWDNAILYNPKETDAAFMAREMEAFFLLKLKKTADKIQEFVNAYGSSTGGFPEVIVVSPQDEAICHRCQCSATKGKGAVAVTCFNATCKSTYHLSCAKLSAQPTSNWLCPTCRTSSARPQSIGTCCRDCGVTGGPVYKCQWCRSEYHPLCRPSMKGQGVAAGGQKVTYIICHRCMQWRHPDVHKATLQAKKPKLEKELSQGALEATDVEDTPSFLCRSSNAALALTGDMWDEVNLYWVALVCETISLATEIGKKRAMHHNSSLAKEKGSPNALSRLWINECEDSRKVQETIGDRDSHFEKYLVDVLDLIDCTPSWQIPMFASRTSHKASSSEISTSSPSVDLGMPSVGSGKATSSSIKGIPLAVQHILARREGRGKSQQTAPNLEIISNTSGRANSATASAATWQGQLVVRAHRLLSMQQSQYIGDDQWRVPFQSIQYLMKRSLIEYYENRQLVAAQTTEEVVRSLDKSTDQAYKFLSDRTEFRAEDVRSMIHFYLKLTQYLMFNGLSWLMDVDEKIKNLYSGLQKATKAHESRLLSMRASGSCLEFEHVFRKAREALVLVYLDNRFHRKLPAQRQTAILFTALKNLESVIAQIGEQSQMSISTPPGRVHIPIPYESLSAKDIDLSFLRFMQKSNGTGRA